MRLFVSALLLAATPLFAQTASQPAPGPASQVLVMPGSPEDAQTGCPLALTGASVAPPGGMLLVRMRDMGDGALDLHFRNSSGREIRAASVTAHLRVKTNVYALDARPIDVRLTFSGTKELDREMDQLTRIALPHHVWLFGVAEVSLDRVTYADGSTWQAHGSSLCTTQGLASMRIDAK